jgi:hypothetical protein
VTKEEMQVLIEQSAELGAKKALRDIGLSDDRDLLSDVSELEITARFVALCKTDGG